MRANPFSGGRSHDTSVSSDRISLSRKLPAIETRLTFANSCPAIKSINVINLNNEKGFIHLRGARIDEANSCSLRDRNSPPCDARKQEPFLNTKC